MRADPAAVTAALADGALVPRDFLWIEPRNRDTGARTGWGAWSDLGTISADVADPIDGVVLRVFDGGGSLIEVTPFSQVAGLSVQTIQIKLASTLDHAEVLVRQYDARLAPVSLYRGFLDPDTMRLVAPAQARFLGFVDSADIQTGAEGGESQIVLSCASHVQELTRKGTATRSDADQRRRDASDRFFEHAADVGTWQIKWNAS